jgi:hypothetical protein
MTPFLRLLACAVALLWAGTLAAQTPCRRGEADKQGISLSVATPAHPTRVAATVDSVLRAQGYTVSSAPQAEGRWTIEPRFTWLPGLDTASWHGAEHPGVVVTVQTEVRRDSTELSVGAQTLCRVPPVPGGPEIDGMVELFSATLIAAGVLESMDSLRARGTDPATPVDRQRTMVQTPPQVAGFHVVGRHDYPDPAYGTNIRYGRDRDDRYVDVYVYPGVAVDSACNAACAVDTEADGFIQGISELVRAGHYESLELADDERPRPGPEASWVYGRHLTFRGMRSGQPVESQYHLYSFPGFVMKVRATYPRGSADAHSDVQGFVDDLLRNLVRG